MATRIVEREKLLTTADVMELLQVSRQTLWNWRKAGVLTCQRVGPRVVRYRPVDVAAVAQPEQLAA